MSPGRTCCGASAPRLCCPRSWRPPLPSRSRGLLTYTRGTTFASPCTRRRTCKPAPRAAPEGGEGSDGRRDVSWTDGGPVDYYTKQKKRIVDPMGHLLYDDTTEAELYMWNTDTKSRLALQVVARESGLPVEELAKRVARLRQLLPDLSDGAVKGMKPATLARLARNVDDIAERVLMLKAAMPEVNVSKVACGYPPVLSMAPAEVSDRWTRVRELLSGASDHGLLRILHECPDVLDTDMLEGAMAELGTMMGDAAIPALESNPRLLYAAEPLDHIRNDFEDVAAALWTPPGGSAEEAVAEAAGEE